MEFCTDLLVQRFGASKVYYCLLLEFNRQMVNSRQSDPLGIGGKIGKTYSVSRFDETLDLGIVPQS